MRLSLGLAILLVLAPCGVMADDSIPADEAPGTELFDDGISVLRLMSRARELRPRLAFQHESVVRLPHDDIRIDSFVESFRASIAAPVSQSLVLRFSGQIEGAFFHFDGDRQFLDTGRRSGDPFDDLWSHDLALEARYAITERWALVGGFSHESSWESGASYVDGIDLNGVLGAAYTRGETLAVIAGVRVGARLGGSTSVSPAIRIGWRITDRIEIETETIGLRVTARLTDTVAVYVSGSQSSQSWALEDRGGSVGEARLRDRSVPVVLGARWKLSKHWRLRGFVGALAYQEYKVRDDDGDTVDTERSNGPAFTFQARVDYRF